MATGIILISGGAPAGASPREICLTFDDLPVMRVHDHIERLKITDRILGILREFKAPAAGFVIGDNIEGHYDLLTAWLKDGHVLGNHTYSHPDLNEIPPDMYIGDIEKGAAAIEEILLQHDQKKRYFRYPMLHYGNTSEARKVVAEFLDGENIAVAHVSIDTDDFAYNLHFEKYHAAGDSAAINRLAREYIAHIMERLESAEKLAMKLVNRPVKHILLLHANRLNAFCLQQLLSEIQNRGYRFISLARALSDPVYSLAESYLGSKGLSYLERVAQSDPDLLPAQE